MFEVRMTRWIIMDKDRAVIAKGTVRNRHLIPVDKTDDKKRILYYTTRNKAKSAFKDYGFYTYEVPLNARNVQEERQLEKELLSSLEPVRAEITIREV
jgi:hypothetical protein